jgi:adenylate cyclase
MRFGDDVVTVNETSDQTFVFADLAGFTALTEAHGDAQAAELAAGFAEGLREVLPDHGAEEVKTIGDAMMVRVDDPGLAIRLGLRIVEELGTRPQFPILRVGMHTGPAVERDGDWFGSTVNVAARIAAAAGGNDVLLSEATREAAGELEGIEFEQRAERRFKNVGRPVMTYRATKADGAVDEMPIDPVCRMAVDPAANAGQLRHEGRTYYFCSLACAEQFARDPASHLG